MDDKVISISDDFYDFLREKTTKTRWTMFVEFPANVKENTNDPTPAIQ